MRPFLRAFIAAASTLDATFAGSGVLRMAYYFDATLYDGGECDRGPNQLQSDLILTNGFDIEPAPPPQ